MGGDKLRHYRDGLKRKEIRAEPLKGAIPPKRGLVTLLTTPPLGGSVIEVSESGTSLG